MATLLPDTDSEDELPPGWEERATLDGKVYYANHEAKTTQWTHPQTGKKKKVSGELPFGWVRLATEDDQIIFVDKINHKTTYTDPRLAFAMEEKESASDIRQRFDANSTALQVLSGRDLSGKVALITGANTGIGFETARALSFHGAEVVFACRDLTKANEAIAKLQQERSHVKASAIRLDLASLTSVQECAKEFLSHYRQLNMLILNAGMFGAPYTLTEDGLEMTFQVNHLGHFYLVSLLEPILIASAPARVVVVSSESHRFSTIDASNVSVERLSPSSSQGFISMVAYNDSKLCNILMAMELNKRLSPQGVTCNALHPGNMVSTSISRYWWLYRLLFFLVRPFTKSLEQAASTTVYCATAVELEGVGGMYFNNCCRCRPSAASTDGLLAQRLWDISSQLVTQLASPLSWTDNRS